MGKSKVELQSCVLEYLREEFKDDIDFRASADQIAEELDLQLGIVTNTLAVLVTQGRVCETVRLNKERTKMYYPLGGRITFD